MFDRLKRIARTAANKASDKVLGRIEKLIGVETPPTDPVRVHGMTVPEPVVVTATPPEPIVTPAPVVVPEPEPSQTVAPAPVQVSVPVPAPIVPKRLVPRTIDPVVQTVPAPVEVKKTRICATCKEPFDPSDPKYKYCRSCAREYILRKQAEADRPAQKPVVHQEDEQIRARLVLAYQAGSLPADVEVKKNGAQVVLIAPVTRHGITVRRSFTYVDEKVAKQIAEERLARARASESHRPKSPEQIRRERLQATKAEAEASRRNANAAKAKAVALEKASGAANLLSETQPSDDTIAAAITAFEATTQATAEAETLELQALAAEQKLAELTVPVETAPKKSNKKKDKKGEDADGKKNGKNGRSSRHAN